MNIWSKCCNNYSFCTIQDSEGKIQSYVSINDLGEESYKALSVEHKKLCEMAELVDEAQEIEDNLSGKKGVDGHDEHGDE